MVTTRAARAPFAYVMAFLPIALGSMTSAFAQSRHDPEAARVEQAAIALVKMLDDGRYDEAAAKLRADAAKYGLPSGAELQQALQMRRDRGRLSNRQTMTVFVQPIQSEITAKRDPAQQVRPILVDFDTDPAVPMLDRRRNAAPYYRESVGGYLMPNGDLLITSYRGAALHSSSRVAVANVARGNAAPATGPGTGTTAPEAEAIEQALQISKLLDAGETAQVLGKIRAGMPEHYGTEAQWAPVAARLTEDFARRSSRGALSDRKVMLVSRSGQGSYQVTIGATGARPPVPVRYGPNPMGSSETVNVQVFGGAVRVLDYKFGF